MNIPQLTEEQKLTCEDKSSAEECYNILESFQINKTPGNDRIPIEFYKVFWPLISDPFLKCVNESFEKGEMSCSQKQAVITLIEKKGKDHSHTPNAICLPHENATALYYTNSKFNYVKTKQHRYVIKNDNHDCSLFSHCSLNHFLLL